MSWANFPAIWIIADHWHKHIYLSVHTLSLQLSPTLCDPMDSSPPGSSVHENIICWLVEFLLSKNCFFPKIIFYIFISQWTHFVINFPPQNHTLQNFLALKMFFFTLISNTEWIIKKPHFLRIKVQRSPKCPGTVIHLFIIFIVIYYIYYVLRGPSPGGTSGR